MVACRSILELVAGSLLHDTGKMRHHIWVSSIGGTSVAGDGGKGKCPTYVIGAGYQLLQEVTDDGLTIIHLLTPLPRICPWEPEYNFTLTLHAKTAQRCLTSGRSGSLIQLLMLIWVDKSRL